MIFLYSKHKPIPSVENEITVENVVFSYKPIVSKVVRIDKELLNKVLSLLNEHLVPPFLFQNLSSCNTNNQ